MMATQDDHAGPACAWPQLQLDELQRRVAAAQAAAVKGSRWYLAHTHARSDRAARHHLQAVGYRVYYPAVRRLRSMPRDRLSKKQRAMAGMIKRSVLEPLFPRYLFLQLDLRTDPWRDVFRMTGISGLACMGDMPSPVPAGFVEGIQAREQGGALPHQTLVAELLFGLGNESRMIAEPVPPAQPGVALPYEVGERVRINDGAFAGFDASIEAMPSQAEIGELDESARVALLAALFGRQVRVSLELGQIEKL